jgi:hypothetical protein
MEHEVRERNDKFFKKKMVERFHEKKTLRDLSAEGKLILKWVCSYDQIHLTQNKT